MDILHLSRIGRYYMKNLSNKHKTTLLYGVLFGYVLSFVFEGRVYFQATKLLSYDTSNQMLMAMFCHMIGLLATGILVKRRRSTKQVMFFTIRVCESFSVNRDIKGLL